MKYRQLGQAGVGVSVIGLGSYLTIGDAIDDATARDTIQRAYALGVNFFDTANVYNEGRAEETLGRHLADFRRDSYVLASKVFFGMGDGPNDRGLSAKHIFEQCHASLKRLRTDYLDLYQCHRPDGNTPPAETVRAMEDLARQGKILYWGVSEWPAWLISEANALARQMGARPAVSCQPRYNLLWRFPESELFPHARACGIGQVVYSPLAQGVLSGKYLPGRPPSPGTRAADDRRNAVVKGAYWKEEYLRRVQEMKNLADELGFSCAQVALAWVLRQTEVSSAIIGATNVSQIEQNCPAADITLSAEVLNRLDQLFPRAGGGLSPPLSLVDPADA